MRALIIVDVQNDFCPGGPLATDRGNEVATLIGSYQESELAEVNAYAHVVATQDWHVDPGGHFSENPDFVDSWPPHCVADTEGARLHPQIRTGRVDAVFRKGGHSAAYSGFEGEVEGVGLAAWLKERGVGKLDVVGIATEHCVRATVLDALREGFEVRVLTGMCAAVDHRRGDAALEEMEGAGAELV